MLTTPDELLKMAERLEHKGPDSINWNEAMPEAASLLRRLAGEMEGRDVRERAVIKAMSHVIKGAS